MISVFEALASALRNTYWKIRAARSANKRRNLYRQAAKEKGHLQALGYASEVVRLYALWCKNPSLERRYKRFLEAFEEARNGPRQMRLFP